MNTTEPDQVQWFSEQLHPHEPLVRTWLQARFPAIHEIDRDDIVQEAYIRVLQIRKNRGELQWPKAFLFTTVHNLALDLLRHRKIACEESLVESGALNVLDGSVAIPEIVARKEELAFLTDAIQSLPDRCRQMFTLRKVYGLPIKEVAAQLAVSEHTVSAQLTIGIRKCAEHLARRQNGKGADDLRTFSFTVNEGRGPLTDQLGLAACRM